MVGGRKYGKHLKHKTFPCGRLAAGRGNGVRSTDQHDTGGFCRAAQETSASKMAQVRGGRQTGLTFCGVLAFCHFTLGAICLLFVSWSHTCAEACTNAYTIIFVVANFVVDSWFIKILTWRRLRDIVAWGTGLLLILVFVSLSIPASFVFRPSRF